jgi:hypothetical protein
MSGVVEVSSKKSSMKRNILRLYIRLDVVDL